MKRLLLTAFEPFAGESINPSLEAARQMEKVSFPGALVRVAELPVDRYRAIEISLELASCVNATGLFLSIHALSQYLAIDLPRVLVSLLSLFALLRGDPP